MSTSNTDDGQIDDTPGTGTDADDSSRSADVVVIDDDFGAVVIGDVDAIESVTSDWARSPSPVGFDSGTELAKFKSQAFPKPGAKVMYAAGVQLNELFARPKSGAVVTYHKMVRDNSTGKIVSHSRIPNPAQAAGMAGPQAAAIIAMEAAINAQFDRIHERLDVIEDKVTEILNLVSAQQMGDVFGNHRTLVRHVRGLSSGNALTSTDWSSIASLGPDLEAGIEKLRIHASKQLGQLDSSASPSKRALQLAELLETNRLRETLQLLVVAQKSFFLWQQLRLERVRNDEPQYLDQTIISTREALREQYNADIGLTNMLRDAIQSTAALRLNEVHHKIASGKLTRYRNALGEVLDEFVTARNLQVQEWGTSQQPGFRDAVGAAREEYGQKLSAGRRKLAGWIAPD